MGAYIAVLAVHELHDRLLEALAVGIHALELVADRRDRVLDPGLVLAVNDKALGHAASVLLLVGGSGREVEEQLEEDKVLQQDLPAELLVGNLVLE